jgi:hypothetical protein
MSIFQANGVCPAILVGVEEILAPNNPGNLITPVGGVQALLDPTNRQGVTIEQIGAGDNGHRKQVRIMYKQRSIPSEIGDEKTCDSGVAKPRFEDTVDVSLHAEKVIHVDEATIRNLCDRYSELISIPVASRANNNAAINALFAIREIVEEILMDLDAIRQKINADFLTAFALNTGTWQGGDTSKTFNVIKSADSAVVLTGFLQLQQELKKIGMNGSPLVFGGGNIDLAAMALGLGCCNAAGQDIGQVANRYGFKFYEDYSDMTTYLGNANSFGMFFPKTAQLVPYNKYVGTYARPIGIMERGTMPDPKLPGLAYDIRIKPNECGEYWDLFINLDYDFYFAPTTLFKDGDRLENVNGVLKAIATAS